MVCYGLSSFMLYAMARQLYKLALLTYVCVYAFMYVCRQKHTKLFKTVFVKPGSVTWFRLDISSLILYHNSQLLGKRKFVKKRSHVKLIGRTSV